MELTIKILRGLLGIVAILGISYLMSNNRNRINLRLVLSGLALQWVLALFILKTSIGEWLFAKLGAGITKILDYSIDGAKFVFGPLVKGDVLSKTFGPENSFIFMFGIIPTIIFVAVLVKIAYHIGLMQKVVEVIAKGVYVLMRVSGAEALSNVASAFVGQVEAQIMIQPYIKGMTKSELLASMAGSMACIAGGVMAIYIAMGVPAPYLLAASLMAAPGALVISKIVYPETEESLTQGGVKLEVKKEHANLLDAISHGCSEGLKIGLNVVAMLIGFIALIAMIDGILGGLHKYFFEIYYNYSFGKPNQIPAEVLSLKMILGYFFSLFAWLMGVEGSEMRSVGSLLGTKFVINEFVAYSDLSGIIKSGALSKKSIAIVSFALCGFANFSSVAIQIGGIGALEPSRREDLSRLGFKALICGTLASYLSATIAGMLF